MDFGDPWRQERHTHNNYIMKANWNRSDNYVGFANTNNHGSNGGSTTDLADKHVSNRVASAQARTSHSNRTRGIHSAEGNNQDQQDLTSDLDILTRGNVERSETDWM